MLRDVGGATRASKPNAVMATGSRTTGGRSNQSGAEDAAVQTLARARDPAWLGTHVARETDSVAPALGAGVAAARPLPPTAARALSLAPPGSAIANWFWLFFDSRGNFATGFENCMLPGNINERIVTFANKHDGFEGQLFLKTGQFGG